MRTHAHRASLLVAAILLSLIGCGAPKAPSAASAPQAPTVPPPAKRPAATARPVQTTPHIAAPIPSAAVAVAALAPQPQGPRLLPAPDEKAADVATVDNGVLTVAGRQVQTGVGAVAWANDSRGVFYTEAPPPNAPTTPEPLYFAPVSGEAPVRLGVSADPWRLSPTAAESVAFDAGGMLAIANAMGPTVVTTEVSLPQDPAGQSPAYPFNDSDFQVSTNRRYAAVIDPENDLAIYGLDGSPNPSGTAIPAGGSTVAPGRTTRQDLPGSVAGDRQQWGAWTPDSSRFLYAVQTGDQRPRLKLWSAATGTVTELGGALALPERGELLVLGWAAREPDTFLAEYVSTGAPRWLGSFYLAGQADGHMQKLWTNGFGGRLSPDDSIVTFDWAPTPAGPMQTWVARLEWAEAAPPPVPHTAIP